MERVVGLGGIFFKARDPQALAAWYQRHLGFKVEEWGGVAFKVDAQFVKNPNAAVVWNAFPADTGHFAPSQQPFMVNYRVADLFALIKVLREEGCQVDDKVDDSEFGKFGWVVDPEGNKIELWEPPAAPT
jgi:catechol 2,3-dioxygenase-like lactoylglutathione lyase family enzyme